tara:strand:- start:440 stop:1402 length:963 start_codon:yes stop_codon:yes gene_type:complete
MKLSQIKSMIENEAELNELDTVLSVEHMLTKYRSAFLDHRIYELSGPMFKTLRKYMVKAMDVKEVEGNLVSYFLIPIVLHSKASSVDSSILDNIDPNAIKNIIEASGFMPDGFRISPLVMPRPSIFGANIYGVFDHPRVSFEKSVEDYFSKDQLISESEGQFVFYVTGYENGSLSKICPEEWELMMNFLSLRISKCINSDISILPPKAMSEEIYKGIFRDSWERLSSSLDFTNLHSIDNVRLSKDKRTSRTEMYFYHGDICIASIDLGTTSDLDSDIFKFYFEEFVEEHMLGEAKHMTLSNTVKRNEIKKFSGLCLTIVK